MSRLFAWRGVLLGALGCALALAAQPGPSSLLRGLPLLVLGLTLRLWAFHHLGPAGRTRDPRPPSGRVSAGPYRFVNHPVYVANVSLALGLVVCAAPAPSVALGCFGGVLLFYAALATRESQQLQALAPRPSAALPLPALLRSERSTWLSVGALLGLQFLA